MDSIMRRACDVAMPRQPGRFKKRKSTYWWNEEISKKRKECIMLRRKWKRAKKTESNIEKEKDYRQAKKELRVMIVKAKAVAWQELIKTINDDPWGLPYRLVLNKLRRNTPTLTETLDKDVLEETLTKLFPKAKIEKERQIEETEWNDEWNVSIQEVYKYTIKRTRTNTAPGIDGVKIVYWKRISDEIMEFVAKCLTICIKKSVFPDQWRKAQLVLIPKGDLDPERPKVRPICLLA